MVSRQAGGGSLGEFFEQAVAIVRVFKQQLDFRRYADLGVAVEHLCKPRGAASPGADNERVFYGGGHGNSSSFNSAN
jgi:hypothetical protein